MFAILPMMAGKLPSLLKSDKDLVDRVFEPLV
jgi:hypothetical protein